MYVCSSIASSSHRDMDNMGTLRAANKDYFNATPSDFDYTPTASPGRSPTRSQVEEPIQTQQSVTSRIRYFEENPER